MLHVQIQNSYSGDHVASLKSLTDGLYLPSESKLMDKCVRMGICDVGTSSVLADEGFEIQKMKIKKNKDGIFYLQVKDVIFLGESASWFHNGSTLIFALWLGEKKCLFFFLINTVDSSSS